MFERPHHRRIAQVLEALDAARLREWGCLFGGGTAMALRWGEYRESVDIDLLISNLDGYRSLRQALGSAQSLSPLLRPGKDLELTRELRADQYGLRTRVRVDGVEIKFEIVLEARLSLEPPGRADAVCGVSTLTPADLVASKLLANADRWADDAVHSRDLIDLAMMAPSPAVFRRGRERAHAAYGQAVDDCLRKAIQAQRDRPTRMDRCLQALDMHHLSKAELWAHIKRIGRLNAAALNPSAPSPRAAPSPPR